MTEGGKGDPAFGEEEPPFDKGGKGASFIQGEGTTLERRGKMPASFKGGLQPPSTVGEGATVRPRGRESHRLTTMLVRGGERATV